MDWVSVQQLDMGVPIFDEALQAAPEGVEEVQGRPQSQLPG